MISENIDHKVAGPFQLKCSWPVQVLCYSYLPYKKRVCIFQVQHRQIKISWRRAAAEVQSDEALEECPNRRRISRCSYNSEIKMK